MRAALIALLLVSCSKPDAPRPGPASASTDRAFLHAGPILAVGDLGATLAYYEETLGFTGAWRWEGGSDFGGIGRGGVWLMFDRNPEVATAVRGHMVWLTVTGVDALYREHRQAGAEIVMELADQPWGFREYRVEDINGYHLRIAEPIPCDGDEACIKTAR